MAGAINAHCRRRCRRAGRQPLREPATAATMLAATKDAPFVNTLGMNFVPVPIIGGPTAGQTVLFSVWDTRVQDYEVFAKETKREWPKPDFEQGPTHPAVNVSWEDAQAFLPMADGARTSGREGCPRTGATGCRAITNGVARWALGRGRTRRSCPTEKSEKINDAFPWGTQWPPPKGAGNYAGEELQTGAGGWQISRTSRM